MMKKLTRIITSVLAVVFAGVCFTGCVKRNDLNTLNIVCLSRGYGSQWIETLARKFEQENEGITVNLNATAGAQNDIKNHLSSRNNIDDLYISVKTDWQTDVARGKYALLDDLLTEEVDGVTVLEKINPEYRDSIYYTDGSGEKHSYRLPWTAGIGGIYYNKKLFDTQNWEVPTTYQALKELCDDIINDPVFIPNSREQVKPFVYTSSNTDYFDYAVFNWWGQLSGKAAIIEFFKYENADFFDYTKNATYANLNKATRMWNELFKNSSYYITGTDNHTSQQQFTRGEAAMMFNAEWLYNETLQYKDPGTEFEHFELALMPTPTANGTLEDGTPLVPVENNISYIVGEDQMIAIPETSIKKDLAKKFIKLMISDEGCKTFLSEANGMLAYNCNYTESDATNAFTKSLLEYRSGTETFFTNYSPSNYFRITIWGQGALRPFAKILGGTSVNAAFDTISGDMNRQWSELIR